MGRVRRLGHRRLSEPDYYLLGRLAETVRGAGSLPRGCRESQAKLLEQGGYLKRVQHFGASGSHAVIYEVTPKGREAWQAYRFVPAGRQNE